jgi:putative transposase
MIRTHVEPCRLAKKIADELNRASGRIYTQVLVFHWRTFRHTGHWLSPHAGERWNDRVHGDTPLYAHAVDAAQQGFYKACATTRAVQKVGLDAKFPYHRKRFRTTIWKQSGIRVKEGHIWLSRARGIEPLLLPLPEPLVGVLRLLEVRLVYDRKAGRYFWHIVYETGKQPKEPPGENTVAVDLGEVHPAVVGDAEEATIILCRERRHVVQGFQKRLAQLQQAMARKRRGSRAWHRLRRAKVRLRAKHQRVLRDLDHKISRAIVEVAVERKAQVIVLGDVRDVAEGVALSKQTNQKIANWSHGQVRQYVEYKASAEGMKVVLVEEAYSSQTCPNCGQRHKPRGRRYRCPSCGFLSHRDVVGQVNILSLYRHGEPGKIPVPPRIKHRIPQDLRVMRRRQGTGHSVKECSW